MAEKGPSSYSWVGNAGIANDAITSVQVEKDVNLYGYEHKNYGGKQIIFFGPGNWSGMPKGWNDRISSFKIVRK